MPSAACVMTIDGSPCAACGKSFICAAVGYRIFVAPPSAGTSPIDAGCVAPKYNTPILPLGHSVGETLTPASVDTCFGVPPLVGTDQMWRFSMSFALVA